MKENPMNKPNAPPTEDTIAAKSNSNTCSSVTLSELDMVTHMDVKMASELEVLFPGRCSTIQTLWNKSDFQWKVFSIYLFHLF